MRLYIIRHADPEYTVDGLTEHGALEAAALGEYCNTLGLDAIYVSPMGRAQDTAAPACSATGLEPSVLEWARELHWRIPKGSRFDGMEGGDGHGGGGGAGRKLGRGGGAVAVWNLPGSYVREQLRVRRGPGGGRIKDHGDGSGGGDGDGQGMGEGGGGGMDDGMEAVEEYAEHAEDFRTRVAAGSDALLAQYGYVRDGAVYRVGEEPSHSGAGVAVAVFCHHGLGSAWLGHLLNVPIPLAHSIFWLAPSSVSCVLLERCPGGLATCRALSVGALPHLYAAGINTVNSKYERGEPPRPSGLKSNYY